MKINKNQIWRSKKTSKLYTTIGISSAPSEDDDIQLVIYENDRGDLTHRSLKEFEEKFEYIADRKASDNIIEPLKQFGKELFKGIRM